MNRDFNLGGLGGLGGLGSLGSTSDSPASSAQQKQEKDKYNVQHLMSLAQKNSGILTIQGQKVKADVRDLVFKDDIGHGSCGTVTKMAYKDMDIMAVKTMPRTSNSYEMSRILMDLDVICRSFDCEYIVRCYGYFITTHDVQVCMEHMATCLDRLLIRMEHKPIPENVIGQMCISIIRALHYLKKRHQIMHRDVKPSNILLDWTGAIKLCDFGIAGRLIESRAHSKQAGCPLYMGPERLDPSNSESYDIRSDVWSLGLTLVELATGKYPYVGSEFEMISKIVSGEPPRLTTDEGFTHDFCDLVNSCLQVKAEDRPNYDQLLEHPFVKYHEVNKTDVQEWFLDVMEE